MKILVCVKRVIDYNVRVRVKADGTGVETAGVKMSMNPFDEIAVEEAVRLKEKNIAKEVVALSIGPEAAQEQLRSALAMGADRAVQIVIDKDINSLVAAKLIKAVVEKEKPDLVIIGKQAIDDDANQTGQMLAGLLGWGQGTFASKIAFDSASPLPRAGEGGDPASAGTPGEGGHILVTREVDGGLMTVKLKMPCIVTTDLRLNEPRYPALPNIMKARSKPLEKLTPEQLNVPLAIKTKILKVEEPKKRKGGGKVKDVAELVDKLKNEAKVI